MRPDAIIILVGIIAFASFALYAIAAWLYAKIRRRSVPIQRHIALYSLATTVTIVLFATVLMTLWSEGIHTGNRLLSLHPFDWLWELETPEGKRGLIEFGYNIVMFVPVGALLPAVFPSLRKFSRILALVAVAILAIEMTQYFIGRAADIDDLISNLLGTTIGYGIYRYLRGNYSQKRWFLAFQGDRSHEALVADPKDW